MINRRDLLRGIIGSSMLAACPIATWASARIPQVLIANAVPELDLNYHAWACWIGHSTVLIRVAGKWILTDPVLFSTYGINAFGITLGPRRITQPALTLDEIPKPDIVLLSHAHMDHMDRKSLDAITERYPNQVTAITATNTSDVIDDLPWAALHEMDWGDTTSIQGISMKALRVKHNGWRLPGEACRAAGQRRSGRSYNGYEIEVDGVRIVFGGDTAYTEHFRDVRKPVDIAIMPIGAYDHFPEAHCTPEESLAMAEMMNARYVLPIHHSTFRQSQEPMAEPLQRLRSAMRKSSSQLALTEIGGVLGLT